MTAITITYSQPAHCSKPGYRKLEVDPKHTSLLCSRCGVKGQRHSKSFHCNTCSLQWDADLNAAVNILRRAFGPSKNYSLPSPAGNPPGQALLMPAETQPCLLT